MRWIKIWTEETVSGTTFSELDANSRGVWFSLLAYAGVSGTGLIQICVGKGFSDKLLSEIINVSEQEIAEAKEKLIKHNKIKVGENGEIEIVNWEKYQDEYHRQKPYRLTKKTLLQKQARLQDELQGGLQDKLQAKLPAEEDKEEDKDKKKNNKSAYPKKIEEGQKRCVLLTDLEYEKLKEHFGEEGRWYWINTLNEGILLKGYKYKSHYIAILKWSKREGAPQYRPDVKQDIREIPIQERNTSVEADLQKSIQRRFDASKTK